jgi:TolB-like protein
VSKPSFFAELQRRNVLRAGVLYAGAVWALAQGLAQLLPLFGDYGWIARWFVIAGAIGFPFWVAFAWFYEFTPQGLKRESEIAADASIVRSTGRAMDKWIIAVLVVAVVLLLTNTFVWRKGAGLDGGSASAAPGKSIAVLPFVNMSGDPQNEYFSDGITEEILDALAQLPNLKVAARTSAFAFKGKAEDLRKVGDVLDVATVLEGSVQKSGDEVRITAQLIDTRSGYHLWSEKYDRKLTSIFAVEDEISKAIADKLKVQLAGGNGSTLVAQKVIDPRAHDFYLRGLTLLAARSVSEAVGAFRQAVAIDPEYAQAWAALAEAQALLPAYGPTAMQTAYADSLESARRALAVNPDVALAYVAQGMVYMDEMRWADADGAFRHALALAPGDAEALNQYGQFLEGVGQLEPALVQFDRALQRDPLSGVNGAIRVQLRLMLHHDDAATAAAQIKAILDAHPESLYVHRSATLIYLNLHRYPEAEAQSRAAAVLNGTDPEATVQVIRGIADPALRPKAVHSLETSAGNSGLQRDAILHAFFLVRLGERDRALAALEDYAAHGNSVIQQLLWFPAFDPIRNDPRFEAVLKKLGLPYTPQNPTSP